MLTDTLIRWFSRPTPARGAGNFWDMPVALHTYIGMVRDENQDRVAAMRVNATSSTGKPFLVIAIADGMGGLRDGGQCATLALSAFFNTVIQLRHSAPKDRMLMAANAANLSVHEFSGGRGGSTLSAILVSIDDDPIGINIGDSRIYATVPENQETTVIRLTVDDSLKEAVGGDGTELLQFVGMGEGLIPHICQIPNDATRILITSDGIHFVRHESLCDVLLHTRDRSELADRLITLATWSGAPDNASLAISNLPELIQALATDRVTAVEIWDAFSALHILWRNPENGKPATSSNDRHQRDLLDEHGVQPKIKPPRKKPTGRKKGASNTEGEKEASEPKQSPQLTLEVNPEPISPEENKNEFAS